MKVYYNNTSKKTSRNKATKKPYISKKKNWKVKANKSSNSNHLILQFLCLCVIICFGVLFVPNLISEDTTRASAQNSQKEIDIFTNFNKISAVKQNLPEQPSQLREYIIPQIPDEPSETANNAEQPSSSEPVFYIVKQGDSLEKISKLLGIDQIQIARVNNLETSNLSVGQKLQLP
jgi:LysM repeat protein